MEDQCYADHATLSDRHWWFVARRKILYTIISRFAPRANARVLEVGCGTGANLALLQKFGRVEAVELDEDARRLANARQICDVRAGSLPDDLGIFAKFDLICLFDVLEHVEDDARALQVLRDRMDTGATLVLTVPAYQFLWSNHDVANQHFRRYTRGQLTTALRAAGFRIRYASYFNTLLFPLVLLQRLLGRLRAARPASDFSMPSAPVAALLEGVFASERRWLSYFALPFGVSLIVVAELDAEPQA
jgi:SAM-dependent methyltransferase